MGACVWRIGASWARLLKRVFNIDIERRGSGGKLKIIAAIDEPALIEGILTHLGLSAQPPPRTPARKVDISSGGLIRKPGLVLAKPMERLVSRTSKHAERRILAKREGQTFDENTEAGVNSRTRFDGALGGR